MTRSERIAELERSRPKLIEYMLMKADGEDWHGVQDAASDLRDLDCELDGLRFNEPDKPPAPTKKLYYDPLTEPRG